MSAITNILVFSENRETRGTYLSFANLHEAVPYFKEKNKTSLQTLLEQKYDLIFVEIMNPVMSEIEYIDQVHSLAKGTPMIVISSYFYDTKDIVFGEKIEGFVMKPFDLEKIIVASKHLFEEPIERVQTPSAPLKEAKVESVLYETKKLSVLLEISKSLNSITDFDELLSHIITLAADTLQAERATLFLVDKKNEQLWSRTGIGIKKQEIRIPLETGIAGEVVKSGQAQIITNPYSHPKFNKDVDIQTGFKTRNILCLPMKNIIGEIIGVFQILNKKEGDFTTEDQNFLAAMAGNTGIAIENALLHDELKKQLVEVKQSYDDLYIAQKQILKETRFVTFSEVYGFIIDVLKKSAVLEQSLQELKRAYPSDNQIQKFADYMSKTYNTLFGRINAYFDEKKKEMGVRG